MSEKILTTVEFHGATLLAVRGDTPGSTLVAMKPVVEGMGLDWQKQMQRIKDHPALGSAYTKIRVQMPDDDQARDWAFLPLNRLNFWLATIQPNKIPDQEIRARVIEYQIECADALFAHFFGKAINRTAPLEPRLWHELPLEERNTEIRTADAIGRYGNRALAFWYLTQQMRGVEFPRQLMPAWHQYGLGVPAQPAGLTLTVSIPPAA